MIKTIIGFIILMIMVLAGISTGNHVEITEPEGPAASSVTSAQTAKPDSTTTYHTTVPPTAKPTTKPTDAPTDRPAVSPTLTPTIQPTVQPTDAPFKAPSDSGQALDPDEGEAFPII